MHLDLPATLVVDAGCIDTLVRLVVLVQSPDRPGRRRLKLHPPCRSFFHSPGEHWIFEVVLEAADRGLLGSLSWVRVVQGFLACNCRDFIYESEPQVFRVWVTESPEEEVNRNQCWKSSEFI